MRIFQVAVTYGELRSTGYPSFSNTRHEVSLYARLEDGETAAETIAKLREAAKADVKRQFGDAPVDPNDPLARPYERPLT